MNTTGNPDPKLIEKALAALQPKYGDPWELAPTSVELNEANDLARVWFEFSAEDMEKEGHLGFEWKFSLCIPLYHFWGRKKREKYIKEQRMQCDERGKKLDEVLRKAGIKN